MDEGHRTTLTASFVADVLTAPEVSASPGGTFGSDHRADVVAPTSWQHGDALTAAQIDPATISTLHIS